MTPSSSAETPRRAGDALARALRAGSLAVAALACLVVAARADAGYVADGVGAGSGSGSGSSYGVTFGTDHRLLLADAGLAGASGLSLVEPIVGMRPGSAARLFDGVPTDVFAGPGVEADGTLRGAYAGDVKAATRTIGVAAAPEPAMVALLFTGLAALVSALRRKRTPRTAPPQAGPEPESSAA